MIDFKALDPETRTVALVGRFLQIWSVMETSLDRTIATALGLTNLANFILANNIGFINKMHVLGCLVSVSNLTAQGKETAKKFLGQMQGLSKHRNIVAHDSFVPSTKTDGVDFMIMRARGKVAFPDEDWSIQKFESIFETITAVSIGLTALDRQLSRAARIPANSFAALFAAAPLPPMQAMPSTEFLDHLSPLPQDPQNSDMSAATPETKSKTPPSPEE